MPPNASAPIGVFDSGLGGLTVVRAVRDALPREDLVYLGDTARVPYGTRSAQTVVRYARTCGRALRERGVKMLVVACNTVSAVALDVLRVELDVPVLGVIEPGARAVVAATHKGSVGVLATSGTITSGAYPRAISQASTRVEVTAYAAPLLVPLVEEGWLTGEVPRLAVRRYVEPFAAHGVDAIVLGCTHYPLLADLIREESARALGHAVAIVDSAHATAVELATFLAERDMKSAATEDGALSLIVTDLPGRFADVASRFLGQDVDGLAVTQIDL